MMNLTLPGSGKSVGINGVASGLFPAGARILSRPGLLWIAVLGLLWGTSGLLVGESTFFGFPVSETASNKMPAAVVPVANSGGTSIAQPKSVIQSGATPTIVATSVTTNNAAGPGTNSMDALDDKYRLAIGDRISFQIEEDGDEPRPLTVMDSGDLEVPYIGRYPAVGKTCRELALALKAELEKEYYYRATVIIDVDAMTKSRGRVYLVGAVRVPGPQEIPSDEVFTVSKAVLRAGGFTDYADEHNVKITRKGSTPQSPEQTLTVNVGDILEKGRIDSDLTLEPGDLIFIPERLVRF